ncbi:hypothetical protein ABZZ79_35050 [Streptomyces sp. NPDC006458]|uniref:hypothetical protein n=1 Tax=Streptomyces sp. NPDC006458 TaxID=3154302 RepID=UPI0033AAAFC8
MFGEEAVVTVAKHLGAPPVFVETGHDVPAAPPAPEATALVDSAVHAVKALGLGWGAAHVELRLDGRAARVTEVNTRLAGGLIPELVRHARGIDLVGAQVRACLGLPVDLTASPDAAGAASIRFLIADTDAVLGDPGGAESAAPAVPGVTDAALYRTAGPRRPGRGLPRPLRPCHRRRRGGGIGRRTGPSPRAGHRSGARAGGGAAKARSPSVWMPV